VGVVLDVSIVKTMENGIAGRIMSCILLAACIHLVTIPSLADQGKLIVVMVARRVIVPGNYFGGPIMPI